MNKRQHQILLNTKVMGHRGAASLAPENTLSSIRAAAKAGATWVEIDVCLIENGGLVIFHDDELDRCTNGKGMIRNVLPEDLLRLDAGAWFSPDFVGEKVPTLVEALDCIQSLGLGLNLEIKHHGVDVHNIVPAVVTLLEEHWQDNSRLMISSFNHGALVLCKELAPHLSLAQLYEEIPENWQEELECLEAYSVNCHYAHLTQQQAQAIKAAGYKLLCYTVNESEWVSSHWDWGMDAVITDDPRKFSSLLT